MEKIIESVMLSLRKIDEISGFMLLSIARIIKILVSHRQLLNHLSEGNMA